MSLVSPSSSAEALKACCAATYGNDLVALLLGPAYHPGGAQLTRRLASLLRLAPSDRVLDVASGPGATARLLAREFDARVHGIDLSHGLVRRARAAALDDQLDERLSFQVADAERLPLGTASVDAVVCECALCTFPSKSRAVAEFARVLRPGGRVGIADVVADPDRLPPELGALFGWIACLAGARPLDGYLSLLESSGLEVRHAERHDEALAVMIRRVDARLRMVAAAGLPQAAGLDLVRAGRLADSALAAVRDGVLGYALIVAARVPAEVESEDDTGSRTGVRAGTEEAIAS